MYSVSLPTFPITIVSANDSPSALSAPKPTEPGLTLISGTSFGTVGMSEIGNKLKSLLHAHASTKKGSIFHKRPILLTMSPRSYSRKKIKLSKKMFANDNN